MGWWVKVAAHIPLTSSLHKVHTHRNHTIRTINRHGSWRMCVSALFPWAQSSLKFPAYLSKKKKHLPVNAKVNSSGKPHGIYWAAHSCDPGLLLIQSVIIMYVNSSTTSKCGAQFFALFEVILNFFESVDKKSKYCHRMKANLMYTIKQYWIVDWVVNILNIAHSHVVLTVL